MLWQHCPVPMSVSLSSIRLAERQRHDSGRISASAADSESRKHRAGAAWTQVAAPCSSRWKHLQLSRMSLPHEGRWWVFFFFFEEFFFLKSLFFFLPSSVVFPTPKPGSLSEELASCLSHNITAVYVTCTLLGKHKQAVLEIPVFMSRCSLLI